VAFRCCAVYWPIGLSTTQADGTPAPALCPSSMTTSTFTDLCLGCAGWSLPREQWPRFKAEGSHLERYASRFNAVEINSSFYRPHKAATYARWATSVPERFRFSVKVPKQLTHELRLCGCVPALEAFLAQCMALGEKLGCLLVQLPPSLAYDPGVASVFFKQLRERYNGPAALEPRHASWLQAGELLQAQHIGWVEADPNPLGEQGPLGWEGLVYVRLHGSPKIYYSAYDEPRLKALADRLTATQVPVWCIFDNTAAGAAVPDALWVAEHIDTIDT
jgi:uncharacterized protein YecE (DUF72 family)